MTYIQPLLSLFFLIALMGWFRWRKGRRPTLAIIGLLGLFLSSWPPADWLFSRPLEMWYPVRALPAKSAEAIVVLGSYVGPAVMERPYPSPDAQTYHRIEFAAWLHKHWRPVPVLACGGPVGAGQLPIAETMRALLQQEGVADEKVWTEERSRNTHENAVFGAEVLRRKGVTNIVLVVDASRMLRAEVCFRKAGITVTPAPSQYRKFGPLLDELLPSWEAVLRNEGTLHETLGLAWYWLHRWI